MTDIAFENMRLPSGQWCIRYYKNADGEVECKEKIFDLKGNVSLEELMLEGYKIGSCWQMR